LRQNPCKNLVNILSMIRYYGELVIYDLFILCTEVYLQTLLSLVIFMIFFLTLLSLYRSRGEEEQTEGEKTDER